MKNRKDTPFKSVEEQDAYLQSASIQELKELAEDAGHTIIIEPSSAEDELFSEEDEQIMDLPISGLRALSDTTVSSLQELSTKEKADLTGLSEEVIQRIEKDKHKATLEEIIAYCEGLKISYKEFLPELFQEQNAA